MYNLKNKKMKNYTFKVLQSTVIIAAIVGTTSCMNKKNEDTKEVAEELNEQKFDKKSNEKDAQFLVDAAEINRKKISLGQLAQQKSNTSSVIELGKIMETDHTKSLAEVTELAKIKIISLPTSQTEAGQEAYKKLNEKSGKEFDNEFCNMMAKGHKEAIELFENASTESTDADIRNWATETLPTLRMHLEQTLMCQKECAKM